VKKLTVVAAAEPETTEVVLEPDRGQDIRRGIFNAMKSADLPILQMRTENMTLEEIFIHLTSGGKEAV
jgi:ABC-2 type transport system ATP-binding protein